MQHQGLFSFANERVLQLTLFANGSFKVHSQLQMNQAVKSSGSRMVEPRFISNLQMNPASKCPFPVCKFQRQFSFPSGNKPVQQPHLFANGSAKVWYQLEINLAITYPCSRMAASQFIPFAIGLYFQVSEFEHFLQLSLFVNGSFKVHFHLRMNRASKYPGSLMVEPRFISVCE